MRPTPITLIVLLLITATCPAQPIIYVNAAATGANDGSSWPDAYTDLQDALDEAEFLDGQPCEIWVAAGTYKPDRGTGDPSFSFQLVDNTALYGGFAGWETERNQRDPVANVTTLSGDLLNDDDPTLIPTSNCCYEHDGGSCDNAACQAAVIEEHPSCADEEWSATCGILANHFCCDFCHSTRRENSLHVIRAENVGPDSILDGFTVVGGAARGLENPDDQGGGILNVAAAPTIRNCIIRDNWASRSGGAVEILEGISAPTFESVQFLGNHAYRGGAVDEYSGFVSFTNCRFSGNAGHWAALTFLYDAVLVNCTIEDNHKLFGDPRPQGVIANFTDPITLIGCQIRNHVDIPAVTLYDSALIINSSFVNNSFATALELNAPAVVAGCLFASNAALDGGAIDATYGTVLLSDSTFTDNTASCAGGAIQTSFLALLNAQNCVFRNNHAGRSGGAIGASGSTYFTDCEFEGNSVGGNQTVSGGGAILISDAPSSMTRCIFRANTTPAGSGGAIKTSYSPLQLSDSIFSGNQSDGFAGGAVFWGSNSVGEIARYTFYGNVAAGLGGGLYKNNSASATINDSIFWMNRDATGQTELGQAMPSERTVITVNYSTIQGWTGTFEGYAGVGGVGSDPLVIDAYGPDQIIGTADDNLHLAPDSPCINAGNPSFVPDDGDADADGHTRLLCGRVDMGAYEFGIGDYDCDHMIEVSDYSAFPACLTGPVDVPAANCTPYDFHVEVPAHIDLLDFAGLQNAFDIP